MSFYGAGQAGNPVVPNQAQIVRAAGSLQPQLFGQLQFPQGSQPNPFDQNNHLLLQSHGAQGFQNLNVSFLSEQLAAAGVGQMISQATSNASNMPNISMQNLMSPMAMTSLSFPSVPVCNTTQQTSSGQKQQRVFTGTVTKAHDNFGFIDDEVFFTTGAVKGPILPKAGDRVLVEAEFNANAAFKWTATRIQIVNIGGGVNTLPMNMSSGKGNNQQNTQQQNYQPPVSAADKQQQGNRGIQSHLVAPPPPIISMTSQSGVTSRHTTSTSSDGINYSHVSIISNPHSVYSSSTSQQNPPNPSPAGGSYQVQRPGQATPARGRVVIPAGAPIGDGLLPLQFTHNSQIPSLFPPEMNSTTLEIMRNTERELDRMDRERERERDRERERERDREREKERNREKEKRELEREKERDRNRRRSPSPVAKKAKTDLWNDRQISRSERQKDKPKDSGDRNRENEKIARNPSPASSSTSRRRSRSRSPRGSQRDGDRDRDRDRESSSQNTRREARDDRDRGSSRTRTKSRSRSPSQKPSPRYSVVVPQYPIDLLNLSVMDLKRRYQRLYIPSDFFMARACWVETFPLDKPLDLAKAFPVVVFRKHSEPIDLGFIDYEASTQKKSVRKHELVPEPEDARRVFSAKVMLLSNVGEPTIYTSNNIRRVMNFIVGMKLGKSDIQAVGGPWSASCDGQNPQSDPQVLIRTAIRTTKASVGIDLSSCKRWFRFMELYYRRSNGVLETVVFFIPDISTCLPSENEWARIGSAYKLALGESDGQSEKKKKQKEEKDDQRNEKKDKKDAPIEKKTKDKEEPMDVKEMPAVDSIKKDELKDAKAAAEEGAEMSTTAGLPELTMEVDGITREPQITADVELDITIASGIAEEIDEKQETMNSTAGSHVNQLDPKQLNVAKLREELSLRGLSTKGLKAQLQSRLQEALEVEMEAQELQLPMDQTEKMAEESEAIAVDEAGIDSITVENVTDESLKEKKHELSAEESISQIDTQNQDTKQESEPEVKIEEEIPVSYSDILVPLVPENADEKTKEMWKRRFSLPKKPHLIAHPLQTGKAQSFDCAKMSLASIREYRAHDVKEQSFEVSLFSELFNEMLTRDFGFKIYQEAYIRTQIMQPEEKEEKEPKDEKSKDEKPKVKEVEKTSSEGKKLDRRPSDASSVGGDSKKSSRSVTEKKIDISLLLAFTFYDTTRCGYIKEIEFEEICLICGLNLTRAQVRKIIQKLFEKDSHFRYGVWTDNKRSSVQDELGHGLQAIMTGNKNLLPVFVYQNQQMGSLNIDEYPGIPEESLLVPLDGSLVDVRKIKAHNDKYEAERGILEANINALTNTMNDAKVQVAELKKSSDAWKSEYLKLKETSKATDLLNKSQADDLETFRRASERFCERIKGLIDIKGRTHTSPKDVCPNGSAPKKEKDSEVKSEPKT